MIVATGRVVPVARGSRARRAAPAAASSTAPPPARPEPPRATTCTSSARPTPPGRRRCTWPGSPGKVVMVVRGDALEKSMSQYLVDRIRAPTTSRCGWRPRSSAGTGVDHLESLTLGRPGDRRRGGGASQLAVRLHRRVAPHRLARRPRSPATPTASSSPAPSCGRARRRRPTWPLAAPARFCSRPASRASSPPVTSALGSMKRVASAVGEGASAVHLVHRYLETI